MIGFRIYFGGRYKKWGRRCQEVCILGFTVSLDVSSVMAPLNASHNATMCAKNNRAYGRCRVGANHSKSMELSK